MASPSDAHRCRYGRRGGVGAGGGDLECDGEGAFSSWVEHMKHHLLLAFALLLSLSLPARGASVFTTRLEDPGAVYVTPEAFGVRGDGASDDSTALQAALDQAAAGGNGGVVFLPSGRYRLTRTLYVWRSVRVIGYGATRPVFVLADETPGYQKGLRLVGVFNERGQPGR